MSTARIPTRQTTTISLPTVPDSSVTVYKSLTVTEQEAIAQSIDHLQDGYAAKMGISVETARAAIVKWNIVGDDDQPLPVTTENLRKLSWIDILAIVQAATGTPLLTDGSDGTPIRALNEQELKKNHSLKT